VEERGKYFKCVELRSFIVNGRFERDTSNLRGDSPAITAAHKKYSDLYEELTPKYQKLLDDLNH
jgi:hypothetical protein